MTRSMPLVLGIWLTTKLQGRLVLWERFYIYLSKWCLAARFTEMPAFQSCHCLLGALCGLVLTLGG